jgi:hypothetical protein
MPATPREKEYVFKTRVETELVTFEESVLINEAVAKRPVAKKM